MGSFICWLVATDIKKESREPHIKVEDNGIFSDYDEMMGQEWDQAFTSPFKNSVCATNSVDCTYIYIKCTIIH